MKLIPIPQNASAQNPPEDFCDEAPVSARHTPSYIDIAAKKRLKNKQKSLKP
ncbi:MAG: hypothetical protein IJN96_04465 [Clostridia bacterium]|nr:hypothetical protein [Clostridia bacterium]